MRDLILLPLVSLLTIMVMLAGGEGLARLVFAKQSFIGCAVQGGAAGERFRPDCRAWTKAAEGPWVENAFNACGYRTAEACAARQLGQRRVAVMGSSTARGAMVPYGETFAARASAALRRLCGGAVDFQNLATDSVDFAKLDQRVDEATKLGADALLIIIGPFDIEHLGEGAVGAATTFRLHDLSQWLHGSRLFEVAQYYLYRDPARQIAAFMANGAPYAVDPLPAPWPARLAAVAQLLRRVQAANRLKLPVVMVYVPERAAAALARPDYARMGDAYVLPRALHAVAEQAGLQFVDSTDFFAQTADFNSLFYRSDGHPASGGHAAIAAAVLQGLRGLPVFAGCGR